MSEKERRKLAHKYIKEKFWKQVGKQKLLELFILPIGVTAIYWLLFGLGKLSYIILKIQEHYSRGDYMALGVFTLFILGAFLVVNMIIANEILKSKAGKKFDTVIY